MTLAWNTLCRPRIAIPLLASFAVGLYLNTLRNGYVYDDIPLFTENEYVQQGWAGIPSILTRDGYDSQLRQANSENRLAGGRYRPLSLVTFAMEVALFGQVAWISHLVNVILFAGVVIVLYQLARRLFPHDPAVWLIFGLAFAVHPIHVEVVANVKSRDELLSLVFMALTCLVVYRSRLGGALTFGLALLAKEYAATLLVLVPLWGWLKGERERIAPTAGMLAGLLGVYGIWRLICVGWPSGASAGVLNHPYLYATPAQALATKLLVLGKYLRLLVWPHPMSYDYSYPQIPYTQMTDPRVWWVLAAYGSMAWLGWILLRRTDPASFGIAWFLGTVALVSNLFANAATIMAERLVFHASAGWLLTAAVLAVRWARGRARRSGWLRWAGMGVCVLASWRVVDRNADWRDEAALFVGDAQAAPNSALVCGNAGSQYLDTYFKADDPRDRAAWLAQARGYSERSIQLDPTAAAAALNLVLIHLEYHDIETAERWRATARALDPGHPAQQRMGRYLAEACVEQGLAEARNRRWDRAEAWLKRALGNDPSHAEAWRYLGGVYFETGALDRARQAWGQSGKPVVWEGF